MQVRAQDHVDVLGRDTRGPQSFEPRPAAAVKVRACALLVVAATGVHQDGQAVPPDQEALDGDDQDSARRVLETRHEPRTVLVEMRLRAVAENLERRQGRAFILDDATQRRVAKCPVRWGRHRAPTISIPTAAVDGNLEDSSTRGNRQRFISIQNNSGSSKELAEPSW